MSVPIVFDMWQTLVPLSAERKGHTLEATAAALGEDRAEFRDTWKTTRAERETRPLWEYLTWLRQNLNRSWSDDALTEAVRQRRANHYPAFTMLRPGTLAALTELRAAGCPLALLSNCSSDARQMLVDSGLAVKFDALVLSAELGIMKPDPQIFRHALTELGVESGFYIGDGDDGELMASRQAGLVDVLMDLGEGRVATHRIETPMQVVDLVASGAHT
jgi:putative hydrolase of the HAD superfamily